VRKKYDSYELEIVISLGFLILFLISINFVSGYSFEKTRQVQEAQYQERMELSCSFAVESFRSEYARTGDIALKAEDKLRFISIITNTNNVALLDSNGAVIASIPEKFDLTASRATQIKRGIRSENGMLLGTIVIDEPNTIGANLSRLSKWDTIFRFAGLICAFIAGAYFLRAILMPYRRIKREAIDYNLDLNDSGDGAGIEYIVNTFKNVIAELEEKKATLENLYMNSEKRADSLARYNEYILGSITSGVVICDSRGMVTKFNPSAQNILQYLEKDCRGKHYRAIFGRDHKLTALLDDAIHRKISHSRQEFEIRRPDNKKLWLGCSSSLLNDEQGEGMGAALLLIDLTEIRKLQEASTYSEKMVALGETAAGLAHEVRNSFAAIIGFANLLRKGVADDPKMLSMVETIRSESLSAEALMTRFLSFAKPLNLNPEPIILGELVDGIIGHCSHPRLPVIKLSRVVTDPTLIFKGDPMLLKQALANLLINACDALPDGGEVRIRAALENKESNPQIVISVIDNGVGISHDIEARLFEPFVSGKPDGTGLGLALVKKIIILHGGRIEVHSKPGKGTRFTLFLPYDKVGSDSFASRTTHSIFVPSV
jgi:PAS domain S-box-containing protein